MTERALRSFGDLISLKFTKDREHSEHHFPAAVVVSIRLDKLTRSAPFFASRTDRARNIPLTVRLS